MIANSFIVIVIQALIGTKGSHLDPCPRHRGLPNGLTRAENSFGATGDGKRAIYRLDLREAIQGYIPNEAYSFRVHTTVRNQKFNDAIAMLDALEPKCGTGHWIVDSDDLHSPKDCPDVVTTQEKLPMGKANFKWRAPECGCVHIRLRVHTNATYYLEDKNVHNGPLARTICSKVTAEPKTINETSMTALSPTTTPVDKFELTRDERLYILCDVSMLHDAATLLQDDLFVRRRSISTLVNFELDHLSLAIEQRALETKNCCSMASQYEIQECFGDVRRHRIDAFCGTGEPKIPFSKSRFHWIKQKQSECCWQIGEDRYACFNHTLTEQAMLKDGQNTEAAMFDMDDFDPANDIEDYKESDKIRQKLSKQHRRNHSNISNEMLNDKIKNKSKPVKRKHETASEDAFTAKVPPPGGRVSKLDGKKKAAESSIEADKSDSAVVDSDNTNKDAKPMGDEVEDADENGREDSNDDDNDDSDDEEDFDKDTESLSDEECCLNGITMGTKVVCDGYKGCFKTADKYKTIFTKWNSNCDRNYVICCMRVIDGLKSRKGSKWRKNCIRQRS